MSQKVHPNGFRLRSQGHLDPSNQSIAGAWDSVWFSEPKKGKHLYTRILHEDQLIQDYTKGLFRSFGFYQQKCVIERKCNNDLHITSYVLRTPKLQPSMRDTLGTRTRQEKLLQDGLQKGWIPFLIKSVVSKIVYDKSKVNMIELSKWKRGAAGSAIKGNLILEKSNQKVGSILKIKKTKFTNLRNDFEQTVPSISILLSPQDSSKTQVLTNKKRFNDFWNSWLLSSLVDKENEAISQSSARSEITLQADATTEHQVKVPSLVNNIWWNHRSWKSTLYYTDEGNGFSGGLLNINNPNNIVSYRGSCLAHQGNDFYTSDSSAPSCQLPKILVPTNLTYSIKPTQSLIESSHLIVDYIADKIEQSVSIQQIFNEILRFFETEALCLGPSFLTSQDEQSNEQSNEKLSERNPKSGYRRPKVLGFRIICSGRLQISSFSKPAEKAESIELTRGVLPLNTFKSNIDFAQTYATNAYGTCGIKVWVNRGD